MKIQLSFLILAVLVVSCKKERSCPEKPSGNVVILLVGDSLEAVYEYRLNSTQLQNDSLPISKVFSSSNSGLNQTALWYFGANTDPLLLSLDGRFSFFGREVYLPALYNFEEAFPFDSSSFQELGSGSNFSYKKVWSNVSKLAMTYDYRFSNPTSKIGISRQIFSVYDESLGLSMPVEKFLIVLAK